MISEEYQKVALAIFAWEEEGDTSVSAALGVMLAIRNRVNAGWHEGSWIQNINYARTHTPGQRTTSDLPLPTNPEFEKLLQLADSVYDGSRRDDRTGGGFYWARPMRVNPKSPFYTEIISDPVKHPRTGVVSGTCFYGDVTPGGVTPNGETK